MHSSTLCLSGIRCPSYLPVNALYEPSLIGYGHVLRLTPGKTAVIHEEKCWFHDQRFSILRL